MNFTSFRPPLLAPFVSLPLSLAPPAALRFPRALRSRSIHANVLPLGLEDRVRALPDGHDGLPDLPPGQPHGNAAEARFEGVRGLAPARRPLRRARLDGVRPFSSRGQSARRYTVKR